MLRKKFLAILLFLSFIIVVSGCGGGEDGGTVSPSNGTTSGATNGTSQVLERSVLNKSFDYDPLGRLVSEKIDNHTIQYVYDKNGNLIEITKE